MCIAKVITKRVATFYALTIDFQIVQISGLEDYFTYWDVISVISLHTSFLFVYFQSTLLPFKVGIS